MGLPVCVCPTGVETLPDGQVVTIRGLSRAEAIQVRGASPNVEAMEKLVLGAGLDVSPQEVDLWYVTAPANVAEQLVNGIARLSGLDGEAGPKDAEPSRLATGIDSITSSPNHSGKA